ncbi:MAG TPA: serine hydrolase domain-containing protein [Gaiellaceae bacterium]|nr:serine hydrolase domain-containing protein [Gaiellaceae bacterium]
MVSLEAVVDEQAAASRFSGVVRVDRGAEPLVERAYGFADRRWRIDNTPDTRFAIASGVKGMTALVVMSLVEEGVLGLATRARELLRGDLPLIADDVTVEHLLAHRSGIGDYFDEDLAGEITDYVLPVPVHRLAETEDYLTVLDAHPTKFAADERFSYCNGGFVVLALLGERASGIAFRELVERRVCAPAGMTDTAFLRSDELPERTAAGYLAADGLRTNVLHLPVRGSGDGGIYTTAADVRALWAALFAGEIVPRERVAEMTKPRSDGEPPWKYGLGFWLHGERGVVALEGYDAGVSFRSLHDPTNSTTVTVIANWSDGAWPVVKAIEAELFG